ncbi:autophagy associated protein kinase regulatory subunit Atg13 [Schizosaccharomyces cryophilus OY26]|uniref:Autophagy-related protein 13 n=1 Tax=Schizosaccharomyces cryophilus (strain OY26 / ATCC MYA-4695 / CBS 11777 / NBRC 106824 / NRRL Y48691) TaxID=653667 RepID=S9W3G2_SCHCR|nr:autophagy associated protein kinase regulatory subunit Atg13 [Schizosaccharomyces cryophilus OY26]EPY52480.1 autophagy associated protein kinase regulatory subunit Atg13 [Schizosaccharomyces cryophilus OY26]
MPRPTTHLPPMYSAPDGNNRAASSDSHRDHSSVGGKSAKIGQVIHHCFYKTGLVILESRLNVSGNNSSREGTKKNKWFNLEVDETDVYADQFKLWKSIDMTAERKIPPMVLHTYFDISDLSRNQKLSIFDGREHHVIDLNRSKASKIVLERWVVSLDGGSSSAPVELAVLYKKLVVLFRSLYTYTHLMPLWKLKSRINRLRAHNASLKVGCTLSTDDLLHEDFVPINAVLSPTLGNSIAAYSFNPVNTPMGNFRISVQYRKHCHFQFHNPDAMLSNQLLSTDSPNTESHSHRHQSTTESGNQFLHPHSSSLVRQQLKSNDPNLLLESEIQQLASVESVTAHAAPLVSIHPFKSPSLSASPGSNLDTMSISPKVAVNRYIHRGPSCSSLNRVSVISESLSKSRSKMPTLPSSGSVGLNGNDLHNNPMLRRFSSSFVPRERRGSTSSRARLQLATNQPIRSVQKHDSYESTSVDRNDQVADGIDLTPRDDLSGFIQLLDNHAQHLQNIGESKSDSSSLGKARNGTLNESPHVGTRNTSGSSNELFGFEHFAPSQNAAIADDKAISPREDLTNSNHHTVHDHTLGALCSRLSFSEKPADSVSLSPLSPACMPQESTKPSTSGSLPNQFHKFEKNSEVPATYPILEQQESSRSTSSSVPPRFEYQTSLSKSLDHSLTPTSYQATKTPAPPFVLESNLSQEYPKQHFDSIAEHHQCIAPSTPAFEYYNEHNANYDDDLLFAMTDMALETHPTTTLRIGSKDNKGVMK